MAHTGLIIDVSDVNPRIVSLPRIISEDQRLVYGVEDVEFRSLVLGNQIVGYATSVEEARLLPQAGDEPLIIKAQHVSPRNTGHIIVSNEDAQRIANARATNDFLKAARVILAF